MLNKKESIRSIIEEHKSLQEDFVYTSLSREKEPNVILTKKDFEIFEEKYKIELPSELVYFYSQIGCGENEFTTQINYYLEQESKPYILVHFSEKFARLICESYYELNEKERRALTSEIKKVDNNRFLSQYQGEIEYLLVEGTSHYDLDEDVFVLSFLNSIYQENYNKDLLIKSLVIWAHCGGYGSIVLNTSKKGFNSGEMFGYFLETEYEGKKYEYYSNYWANKEIHHLEEYRGLIEDGIVQLKERRKQPRTKCKRQ